MCHLILLGVVLLLCQNVRLFGVRVEENLFYLKPIRCETPPGQKNQFLRPK